MLLNRRDSCIMYSTPGEGGSSWGCWHRKVLLSWCLDSPHSNRPFGKAGGGIASCASQALAGVYY